MVLMAFNVTGITGSSHMFSTCLHSGKGSIRIWGAFFQWENFRFCRGKWWVAMWTSCGLSGNDWIFQQDNATVHNIRLVKDLFQKNNITLLDHPAWSPDLSPIEIYPLIY